MGQRIFTKEQIEKLLKNENVVKCSDKTIGFSKTFKIKAVQLYHEEGMSPIEIFRQAGFDLSIIGKKKPKGCMERWNKVYRTRGFDGLKVHAGIGRKIKRKSKPKTKELSVAEKIKWLEAEVAYLKAENDFLAKLRASRRE